MKKITQKEQKRLDKKENVRKDKEWSISVKINCNNQCVICGEIRRLNAHHIIPREFKETRWVVENGVALCPRHHKFGLFSAHRNPYWFINLLLDVGYNNKILLTKIKELQRLYEPETITGDYKLDKSCEC